MKNHLDTQATAATAKSTSAPNPTHDQIAARAYDLYVKDGRQEGRSTEHWLRAEQLLIAERASSSTVPANLSQSRDFPPADSRQQPYARDDRNSASREEIRRQTSPMRPPARQSLRPQERSRQGR